MLACPYCYATLHQKREGYNETGVQRYKCLECGRKYTPGAKLRAKPGSRIIIVRHCATCGRETTNPKFCCHSCAATYTNKAYPKRKKITERFCKYCGKSTKSRSYVCTDCNPNKVDWSRRTVGEIQYAAKYQVSAALRTVARRVFKESQRPRICQNCGYEKHVEICHIQAINSFPPDTPVSVVSGPDNLVALCPNCHWEFDHGLLLAVDIPGLKP